MHSAPAPAHQRSEAGRPGRGWRWYCCCWRRSKQVRQRDGWQTMPWLMACESGRVWARRHRETLQGHLLPRAPPVPPPTHLLAAVAGQLRLLHAGGGPAGLHQSEGRRGSGGAAGVGEAWQRRLEGVWRAGPRPDVLRMRANCQCTCTRTLRRAARGASGRAWAGAKAVHDMVALGVGCGWWAVVCSRDVWPFWAAC